MLFNESGTGRSLGGLTDPRNFSVRIRGTERFQFETTRFFNPMKINWKYSWGNNRHSDIDPVPVQHKVYVTYRQQNAGLDKLYLSNLHWAVANDGATSPKEVVKKTWLHFSKTNALGKLVPANLTSWDGKRKFYYYKTGGYTGNTAPVDCLAIPSIYSDCVNFVDLFVDSLAVNGIANGAQIVEVKTALADEEMLIKNWEPIPAAPTVPPNPAGYLWEFFLYAGPYGKASMVAFPGGDLPDSEYNDLRNISGLPGQNTATPVEKVFKVHSIAKLPEYIVPSGMAEYFDPSYGIIYQGEQDFENKAVFGYALKSDDPSTPELDYRVREAPIAGNIRFIPSTILY